jgi:nucleotide-binding universal stress UspA family protein
VIVLCFDGTPESRHAIEAAARLLEDRDAVVVDVAEAFMVGEDAALTPGVDVSALAGLNRAATHERVEAGVAVAQEHGFHAVGRVVSAAPTWEGIRDVADEVDAAVIVAGSRRRAGLRRLLEGSVSAALVEHATRPVLLIPW